MREVTTLGCDKNLTKQAHCVVQCCQLGGIALKKDETKHKSIFENHKILRHTLKERITFFWLQKKE